MSSVHGAGTWEALAQWLPHQSQISAVVCDVYGTLLEVTSSNRNATTEWAQKWHRLLPNRTIVELPELKRGLDLAVQTAHQNASQSYPEVDWILLMQQVAGAPNRATARRLATLHALLSRHCQLFSGAHEFLRTCTLPLGICSNAQAYTQVELWLALRRHKLKPRWYRPLVFWSYQEGTAKPNPQIFERLAEQSAMPPARLLMVGDRIDNDVSPAREAGWSTWHLT
jgi:FMN phosphatase YigB (HAD superfamily)